MHRTTTTAALLITVAVSALTGCVTVRHPAPAGLPRYTAPSLPAVPRPAGSAEPRVVQAPAVEALRLAVPSPPPRPAHPAPPASHRRPASAGVPHRAPAPPKAPLPRPAPSGRPPAAVRAPAPATPPVPDLCALGKVYGSPVGAPSAAWAGPSRRRPGCPLHRAAGPGG
nr:hypothetical protein [Streptomyces sp. Caat 7-52]